MQIITKSQALSLGLKKYFNGEPCPKGHICERFISDRGCVECKSNYTKIWKTKNTEQVKNTKKNWAKNNKDKEKEYNKRSREKHKDKLRLQNEHDRRTNPSKYLLFAAKRRATVKNITFNLDMSDVVIPEYCPVLGIPLANNIGGKKQTDNSPTLDRIDINLGYIKGNVVVISAKANRIKNDATLSEIKKVASFYENLLA